MPCYHPITVWRSVNPNPSGKFPLIFKYDPRTCGEQLQIPCAQCIGCELEKSRQWAMRAVHEAQFHDEAMFLTLTFRDSELPEDAGLHHSYFQKFMKRYRKAIYPNRIRFLMCGEYGGKPDKPESYDVWPLTYFTGERKTTDPEPIWRPHFHAAIFGHEFKDLSIFKVWTDKGREFRLYTSPSLDELWTHGYCTIGDLTFESAAYIARYTVKKITGSKFPDHYKKINRHTGEIYEVDPEYLQASRGRKGERGLGYQWWSKYKEDTHKDTIHVRGVAMKPPKYYDRLLEEDNPDLLEQIKIERQAMAVKIQEPSHRLQTMEEIKQRKLNKLKRDKE